MSSTNIPETQVIVETAQLATARAELLTTDDDISGLLGVYQTILRTGDGGEAVHLRTHEQYLPAPHRPRGGTHVDTVDSFISLANRSLEAFEDEDRAQAAAFLDQDRRRITVVLNYLTGWRDHRVSYEAEYHADFRKWLDADMVWRSQEEFANLLQDLRHTIVKPDAADVVQIARTFTATRTAHFESGVHLQSGDVQLSYVEDTTAAAGPRGGTVEVPEIITIRLAPYRDALELVEIDLEFRFKASRDGLALAVRMLRRDEILESAWATIAAHATEHLKCATYTGSAPSQISPHA